MIEPKVLWRKYKKYEGPMIRGTTEFPPPEGDRATFHIDRAFWLTAAVETGAKFGAVMAYDGTAMTAGLDQHVAVYPRELSKPDDGNAYNDQGTLWKLLRRIEMIPKGLPWDWRPDGRPAYKLDDAREQLWLDLAAQGWYLAQDGVLRFSNSGEPVPGRIIRNRFTPVPHPKKGTTVDHNARELASMWVRRFHRLFAHPDTFQAQIEYGKEHLVKRTKRRKLALKAYPKEITALRVWGGVCEGADLALCMYQAHSVNAPAIANKALQKALKYRKSAHHFAHVLIYTLGNSKYGRWDDDLKNGRYQRTRKAARASGLWSKKLFDGPEALMPKDLPG